MSSSCTKIRFLIQSQHWSEIRRLSQPLNISYFYTYLFRNFLWRQHVAFSSKIFLYSLRWAFQSVFYCNLLSIPTTVNRFFPFICFVYVVALFLFVAACLTKLSPALMHYKCLALRLHTVHCIPVVSRAVWSLNPPCPVCLCEEHCNSKGKLSVFCGENGKYAKSETSELWNWVNFTLKQPHLFAYLGRVYVYDMSSIFGVIFLDYFSVFYSCIFFAGGGGLVLLCGRLEDIYSQVASKVAYHLKKPVSGRLKRWRIRTRDR
jgi:hypothetical protein